tara:strand:+ start:124498 stop:125472 length:975 start_codon:yes stop_codon:yes gene_type:complete
MANNKGYKRSWRNYLLDPSYQLRFTLTMLAVAAGLMAPLGWWVSQKATTATEVALNQIDEIRCPEVLTAVAETPTPTPTPTDTEDVADLLNEDRPKDEPAVDEAAVDEPIVDEAIGDDDELAPVGEPPTMDEVAPDSDERPERAPIKVNIDDSEMPEVVVVGAIEERPPTPEEIQTSVVARDACLAKVAGRRDSVQGRKSLITIVMLISGVVLLLGLGVYGIKTTHRVAGPLFKVGLYLKKLENNIYDTVYNLRKGDQLVEFYDHFKDAHAGVTTMQEEDRDRLKDAIKLAREAGLADKSEELAASIAELERLLAEKEASLVQK